MPLVSDANHVFEGINVRMTWRKSCSNPALRLLANLAREMRDEKFEDGQK